MRKLLIAGAAAVAIGSFGGTVSADEHPGKGPSACSSFVPGPGVAEAAKGSGFSGDANPSGFVAFFCNPNNGY
jgi:hypothetical protein